MSFSPIRTLIVFGVASACVSARSADRVRLLDGKTLSGSIVESSREALRVETIDGLRTVPAADVAGLYLDEEPALLTQARVHFSNRGYASAIKKIEELGDLASASEAIRQEAAYLRVVSASRRAEAVLAEAPQAGRELSAFLREQDQSVHYYDATAALGDLLTAMGRHEQAERAYGELAKSTSRSIKARAALLVGLSRQARGDHPSALKRFDAILSVEARDASERGTQATARRSRAVSLAATGRLEEALRAIRGEIEGVDPSDTAALAAAYNAVGRCYEAAGKTRDALYAYLHTDLLFGGDPATHPLALSRLAELWVEAGKPAAAREAADRLRRQYASAPEAGGPNLREAN